MNSILLLVLQYRYLIILPFAIIEGPIFALLIGFLVYAKVLDLIPAFFVMVIGDFIPDTAYYFIGYYGYQKGIVGKIFRKEGRIFEHVEIIKGLWQKHPRKTMFVSKLAWALSTPLLITAGLAKIPYKKFFTYALVVTFFQYGLCMGIGYYLGYSYQTAVKYAQLGGIIFAAILILFIVGYVFVAKYFRKQFIKIEQTEEQKTL
jgi:membrane protein DedA with SNARE-associated domain